MTEFDLIFTCIKCENLPCKFIIPINTNCLNSSSVNIFIEKCTKNMICPVESVSNGHKCYIDNVPARFILECINEHIVCEECNEKFKCDVNSVDDYCPHCGTSRSSNW